MKKFITKWITTPSGSTVEVPSVQLWEVRWTSRYGEYSGSTKPEAEFFTSESIANAFASRLRESFALIKHTHGNLVEVKKAA